MSKPYMVYLCVVLFIFGCASPSANVNYSLSDEQLSRLMFDLQLSDVILSEATGATKDSLSDAFWLRLTEIYKLSKPDLTEEVRKLEMDPEKMKVIMDQVQVLSDSIR